MREISRHILETGLNPVCSYIKKKKKKRNAETTIYMRHGSSIGYFGTDSNAALTSVLSSW